MDLREMGWDSMDWMHLTRTGTSGRLVYMVMNIMVPYKVTS